MLPYLLMTPPPPGATDVDISILGLLTDAPLGLTRILIDVVATGDGFPQNCGGHI